METNLRTLGPAESKVVLTFRQQGRQIVEAGDIRRLLNSDTAARKVIRNLLRKGWLSRIIGGRYMLLPPEHGPENLGENNILALAGAAVEPSYVGWWSAASYHGFTTQKPMTVFVGTLKQTPAREIEGNSVRFIKLSVRKFFGCRIYDVYGCPVAISTPAKTLADCLDRPDLCGGTTELVRITHAALSKLEPREILEAALQMKSKALLQRLGFLSDLVGHSLPDDLRAELRAAIPKNYRFYFGRPDRRAGDIGFVPRWGLIANASRKDLLSDVSCAT